MIHASLLTLGELLKTTGDFFKDKFVDICKIILRYKERFFLNKNFSKNK